MYQAMRRMLVDELGIDPGPALQRLERDVLMQDRALDLAVEPRRLPSGTATLAFTDIEDSTGLLQRLGDSYATLLTDYRRIVRESFELHDGCEVDRQGDGLFFAFARHRDAAQAAVASLRAIDAHNWPEEQEVRVRIGLHTDADARGRRLRGHRRAPSGQDLRCRPRRPDPSLARHRRAAGRRPTAGR